MPFARCILDGSEGVRGAEEIFDNLEAALERFREIATDSGTENGER